MKIGNLNKAELEILHTTLIVLVAIVIVTLHIVFS